MGDAVSHRLTLPFATLELPETLPLFVLPSILLLPRGRLPLNIFEPRYLALVDDALSQGRMMGIVQQMEPQAEGDAVSLYKVGCMGRIMSFSETEKGNYLLSLQGVSRFGLGEELPSRNGYRRTRADFTLYADDQAEAPHGVVERGRLFAGVASLFQDQQHYRELGCHPGDVRRQPDYFPGDDLPVRAVGASGAFGSADAGRARQASPHAHRNDHGSTGSTTGKRS
ncbi:MAG: LON peptidase substrate-binding domain-containing protein [Alphaproteobacteria bacterium]